VICLPLLLPTTMSSVSTPLLDTIEPDDPTTDLPKKQNTRPPVVHTAPLATTENDAEAGV